MRKKNLIILIFLCVCMYSVYAEAPKGVPAVAVENGKKEEELALRTNNFQLDGIASYYADDFHQKVTANGEKFNMNAYTAAHRTLPFNTVVEVTNLHNGKKVTVRINDRGPYLKNRVIDLSKKAAETIDMIGQGTTQVSLRIVRMGKKDIQKITNVVGEVTYKSENDVMIQIASYSQINNAHRLVAKLSALNIPSEIETERNLYRVVLHNVEPEDINPVVSKLKQIGFNNVLVKHSKF